MNYHTEVQRLRSQLAAPVDPAEFEILRAQPDARVIPLSRSRHVRGWHPVRPGHRSIAFESKLEAKLITCLAQLPELESIRSQPITVHYRCAGVRGRYTPDFLVELSEVPPELAQLGFGLRTYVEVKPLWRSIRSETMLVRKVAALRLACKCPVVLVTDWDLSPETPEVRHVA
ncbi:hypothetical protein [Marilutibacter chinensis]|uniref:TnsA endonuclease-like protein n=1 Tax=Marilutibacter chinensis TaxID=2912247 RepID=A0ABS9HU32_9GAMM|nr:hypothetical protein [Lysobacter chinensis]MCF7221602.1 hypothetical protein [Lysobacter chinensis]